jgi:predicted N-acyltransferase
MPNKQKSSYVIAWQEKLSNIDQAQWDALAIPLKTPFLEWDWLRQLEVSGSLEAENGWLPYHLTVWSEKRLVAAAPLYIKGHSAGEFVFDHAWADLAGRLGIRYYPKITVPASLYLIMPGRTWRAVWVSGTILKWLG